MSCPAHLINPVQLILRRAEADANLNHISPLYEELVFEAPAYVINITQKSPTKYGEKKVEMTFQHPDDPALDKKTAAEIIMTFYQLLVERGEKDTGLVIRYISSSNR